MRKYEIIDILNKYKFNTKKYVVISGAALVLQDIINETSDIDLSVSKDYYEYLLDNYNCEFERINEYNEKCYMVDKIINFGTSYYPSKINKVNGINVASLDDILHLKKYLNRDKDRNVIKKLELLIGEGK